MFDDAADILISVDDRHVQKMLDGTKTVELRRRAMAVKEGSRVWIYAKVPIGQLKACGIVQEVYKGAPNEIWKLYGPATGIAKREFDHYFDDVVNGCAIVFKTVNELENKISLKDIRDEIGKFQPPQFFKCLRSDGPELKFFKKSS